jgi:hypothetical protein
LIWSVNGSRRQNLNLLVVTMMYRKVMRSFLKISIVATLALALWTPRSHGFALLGPFDTWQDAAKNYLATAIYGGDLGGPQNLGEEYRYTVPTLYYAFDSSFLDYFGQQGAAEIDKAMAVFNALPPVSSMSADLKEFPLNTQRINVRGATLGLLDVKTRTMSLIAEQLGLAQAERFAWTLRARVLPNGAQCPNHILYTIRRNFDPVTWQPTPYVNGTLYTYIMVFACSPAPEFTDAFEVSVDPLAPQFTSVSSFGIPTSPFGKFYTGLTRDDVGGLRYLYRPGNFNYEAMPPDVSQDQTTAFAPYFPISILLGSGISFTNLFGTNAIAPTTAVRGGIDKVSFVRVNYESGVGRLLSPFITNRFSSVIVTNGIVAVEKLQRVVVQPDFVFTARDLVVEGPPTQIPAGDRTVPNFNTALRFNGLNGPGTIDTGVQVTITYNKIGEIFSNSGVNSSPSAEVTAGSFFQWASFDGTSKSPVIYPSGTSIREFEARILGN